jgi:16S rRNA (guanine966-N2)-methyltransferase
LSVRVIAGQYRGTRLHSPPGFDIRPTADRLRETIFNIIGVGIFGKRILDLFAGTGAMGIEALSRGATHAVFVDHNPRALELIRKNIAKVKAGEQTTIISWDIARDLQCLRHQEAFDLVFIDPPYRQGLIQNTLVHLRSAKIGFRSIVIEHDAKESIDNLPAGFILDDQRCYGKTLVSFLGGMV